MPMPEGENITEICWVSKNNDGHLGPGWNACILGKYQQRKECMVGADNKEKCRRI